MASFEPFVCGGIAACYASMIIHPIDLAKVRLQMMPSQNKPSFLSIMYSISKNEGISALYAGLSAAIMRQGIFIYYVYITIFYSI